MFSYPHPGFWAIHLMGIALVYALGKSSVHVFRKRRIL